MTPYQIHYAAMRKLASMDPDHLAVHAVATTLGIIPSKTSKDAGEPVSCQEKEAAMTELQRLSQELDRTHPIHGYPSIAAEARAMGAISKAEYQARIKVTHEPPGLDSIEECRVCRKPTRYWANAGEYPLCQICAHSAPDSTVQREVGPLVGEGGLTNGEGG